MFAIKQKNKKRLLILVFFTLLLVIVFLSFIVWRNRTLNGNLNINGLLESPFVANQFPKQINQESRSYSLRCIHTKTNFNDSKLSEEIIIKVSIECTYLNFDNKMETVSAPLVIEVIKNDILYHQFLGGNLGNGIFENSKLTKNAIIRIVTDQLKLDTTGSDLILVLTNQDLLGEEGNELSFTNLIYETYPIPTEKFDEFAKTGHAEPIQFKTNSGKKIVLPEQIILNNIVK